MQNQKINQKNINDMKTMILKNWNVMRLLRLAIGVWAIISAVQTGQGALGLLGAAVLAMAIFNIGCCGVNGCAPGFAKNKNLSKKPGEIDYEEII